MTALRGCNDFEYQRARQRAAARCPSSPLGVHPWQTHPSSRSSPRPADALAPSAGLRWAVAASPSSRRFSASCFLVRARWAPLASRRASWAAAPAAPHLRGALSEERDGLAEPRCRSCNLGVHGRGRWCRPPLAARCGPLRCSKASPACQGASVASKVMISELTRVGLGPVLPSGTRGVVSGAIAAV